MVVMKTTEFLQDRVGLLETGMPHGLVSSHTCQHEATESLGNLDTASALIDATRLIEFGLATVVARVAGQVVRDSHQHTPQSAISLADDRTTGVIRLITLVTRGIQAAAAGDRVGIRVTMDRAHFGGQLGCRYRVDAGDGQETNVGRPR